MELLKYVYFCAQKSTTMAGNNMFQDLINDPRTVRNRISPSNPELKHYANTPMQYTAIFHGCQKDNF